MTTKPNAAAIITAALALLRSGLLPSNLPARLMADYSLTHTEALRLAARAINRWKAETRPRGADGGKRPD